MKQTKKFSALAAGIVTTSLLLGASAAQAANVEIVNGNVIRVTDLALNLDQDDLDGLYNVDFVTGVGSDIYGDPPSLTSRSQKTILPR
jgi:hypothetical protein